MSEAGPSTVDPVAKLFSGSERLLICRPSSHCAKLPHFDVF